MAAEISFTLSEQDYVEAARADYLRKITSLRHWRWPTLFLAACWGVLVYLDSSDLKQAMYVGAAYAALMAGLCLIFALGGLVLVAAPARRMFRQQLMQPESRMSWSDEGLENHNQYGSFAAKWSDFHGWCEVRGSFLIFINEGFYYLIPRRAVSEEQARDLSETLERAKLARR